MWDLSSQSVRELISGVRDYYGEGCFACGGANPHGLRMEGFRTHDGYAVADFHPREELRGTYGTLHGGVVTTTLDEISVWAAILSHHTMVVTGRIEVRFHRPARVDDPGLLVRGRVTERRGKRLVIGAELLSGEAVCASSEGLFIATESLEEMGIRLRDG
ncbi:MAG: PaaI family thioesterase [bacterium]|nr:PaaI family thioesterase [bacterium]MDE0601189.1 PaaI family thioesterase [bacterium]